MPSSARREPSRNGPRGFVVAGHAVAAGSLDPGLHVVATPIGNLGDITLRGLETLAAAAAILAEDTRTSRKLLSHYGISTPLIAYHEHNAAEMRPKVLARLAAGEALALISDAGTPLVSDPGFKLVREAIAAGYRVHAVPGPSAVLAALVGAGLPTDRFHFEGFLPTKASTRQERLAELARYPATIVIFESPRRLAATLGELASVFGDRPAAIARELTKFYEEFRRGTLPELAAQLAGEADPKGEIVLVVGPPLEEAPMSAADLDVLLAAALGRGSLKDAAAEIAAATGLPRREVYARALALTAKGGG
jgi:16S rRNA (cytidine1402-2'-O)-methyltransferase